MDSPLVISNILEALRERAFPTVTMWNRLEGRPRTAQFDRALKAEVRDALWMLTKQWQMGEFRGEDAGSPIAAKIHVVTTRLNKYRPGQHAAETFDDSTPLEAAVERRPIPWRVGDQNISLDIRLLMGRQWLKMLGEVGDYGQLYIDQYPVAMPPPDDALTRAQPEVLQQLAALAGRAMDGKLLYNYLVAGPARHASDEVAVPAEARDAIDALGPTFVAWFDGLFYQPQGPETNAWQPDYLEYQFSMSAPEDTGEKTLAADEYYHGHLDWYNLDVDDGSSGLGAVGATSTLPTPITMSFIPTRVTFEGMPNTRWWAFEDRRANFGAMQPGTSDLVKLLFAEFQMVYGNDWFLLPLTLPVGSITRIKGLAVTNVFGERYWIEPAGTGLDDDWQHWDMFTLSTAGDTAHAADTNFVLLPTVAKVQDGEPVEDVLLIRDEVANMVWGIETRIPLADGSSKSGREAALERHSFLQAALDRQIDDGAITVTPVDFQADIRYDLMTTVPENWIPFIPVHLDRDNREIQLQRAAMPRVLEGGPRDTAPDKVQPRTVLLREGLDNDSPVSYHLHEEQVPRAGVRVFQTYRRTRWYRGKVFVWLGIRKQSGRGEGSSGLAFDQILPVERSTDTRRGP